MDTKVFFVDKNLEGVSTSGFVAPTEFEASFLAVV
jgi:hypothetical protein